MKQQCFNVQVSFASMIIIFTDTILISLGLKLSTIKDCVIWMTPFALAIRDEGFENPKILKVGDSAEAIHDIQCHTADLSLLVSCPLPSLILSLFLRFWSRAHLSLSLSRFLYTMMLHVQLVLIFHLDVFPLFFMSQEKAHEKQCQMSTDTSAQSGYFSLDDTMSTPASTSSPLTRSSNFLTPPRSSSKSKV